ncbi:MAG TPA: hypothetical protein VF056_05785 [Thermoleophilaceae bacterium]
MRVTTRLLALPAVLLLMALAPAAQAATPFTAGVGHGHDLAVGSDGTGHVVWLQEAEPADGMQYCRVPAGGSACDSESAAIPFPGPTLAANATGDAQVFTPAANKVVILASCWDCGLGGITDRTFRWISTNNGVDFAAPVEIGRNLIINGQAAWVDGLNLSLGVEGAEFQATDPAAPNPDLNTATLASGGLFVYSPAVIYNETLDRAVYVTNDLDTVKYAYRADGTPTPAELNSVASWQTDRVLSSPEGDNDETALSSGPSGILLTYKWFVPNDNRLGLRKFDPATNTFGGPIYIEGADPIDNNSLEYPYHSQDGSGRIHAVWRTLYDDGRLRYSRSDDGGTTFSAAANLALKETFIDPIVEAAPSGAGFAVWRGIGESAVRVVPIDPQPEPAAPVIPVPDTTPPTAGGFSVGDPTLFPGQGTSFSFNSSETGVALLTIQKQVKGLKTRVRGRRRCVPQTRRRLRALRRRADSPAEFRRLLRRQRCRAYKRIGRIRQNVTPGRNTIVFNGRIAGRRLRPGRYRALLVITDSAGNVSRTERIRFRVLRRRR